MDGSELLLAIGKGAAGTLGGIIFNSFKTPLLKIQMSYIFKQRINKSSYSAAEKVLILSIYENISKVFYKFGTMADLYQYLDTLMAALRFTSQDTYTVFEHLIYSSCEPGASNVTLIRLQVFDALQRLKPGLISSKKLNSNDFAFSVETISKILRDADQKSASLVINSSGKVFLQGNISMKLSVEDMDGEFRHNFEALERGEVEEIVLSGDRLTLSAGSDDLDRILGLGNKKGSSFTIMKFSEKDIDFLVRNKEKVAVLRSNARIFPSKSLIEFHFSESHNLKAMLAYNYGHSIKINISLRKIDRTNYKIIEALNLLLLPGGELQFLEDGSKLMQVNDDFDANQDVPRFLRISYMWFSVYEFFSMRSDLPNWPEEVPDFMTRDEVRILESLYYAVRNFDEDLEFNLASYVNEVTLLHFEKSKLNEYSDLPNSMFKVSETIRWRELDSIEIQIDISKSLIKIVPRDDLYRELKIFSELPKEAGFDLTILGKKLSFAIKSTLSRKK